MCTKLIAIQRDKHYFGHVHCGDTEKLIIKSLQEGENFGPG